ncbi:acyl-CoA dehydrogenase C-terminal domain-containing protein, partial [Variovorax sp. E3]|uniref:acyl-CoA dehydrogenase C-terminal domain-containing protein n=1 Tax=Variovorax sp. E3 TaxID=1914993 RepID=UPI0018DDAF34
AKTIAAQIEKTEAELAKSDHPAAAAVLKRLTAARLAFIDVVDFVAGQTKASPNAVFSGSVPYLMLAGNLVAGWQLARSLIIAQDLASRSFDTDFMLAKIATARFYAEHILNKVPGIRDSIVDGAESVTAMPVVLF